MRDLTKVRAVIATTSCEEALEKINNEGWLLIAAHTSWSKEKEAYVIKFHLGHEDMKKNPYSQEA